MGLLALDLNWQIPTRNTVRFHFIRLGTKGCNVDDFLTYKGKFVCKNNLAFYTTILILDNSHNIFS